MKKTITKLTVLFILVIISSNNLSNAQKIGAGSSNSLFVCADGQVEGVGSNNSGSLGNGANLTTTTVVQISGFYDITEVSGGQSHSLFLKNDGTAWASGANGTGQLGDGTLVNKNTPIQVPGLTGIIAIAAGYNHSLFLKNDGTVWSVGYNFFGLLGDGTTVNRSSPVQVLGLTGIIAIAGGFDHSLFLKNDGTVWAVGRNNLGQLGDGTQNNKSTPVQVLGLTGITAITARGAFSVYLKNDGTVWGSGENSYGQLGDGTMNNLRVIPVQVFALTGIIGIAAGTQNTLFLKDNGTVWGVGHNSNGTLGDGTSSNNRTLPVQVIGLSEITAIAAGGFHSIFLKNDGTVWTVGNNDAGQIGDGTVVDKSTSVQIFGLCSPLGTEENTIENGISIYPNPCIEQIILDLERFQNTTAELFNLQGRLLQTAALQTAKTNLQINHLSSGIYLLQLKNADGIVVKKIVKN